MQIKRLIVIIVPLLVAAALTWIIIYARIPLGPVTLGFGSDAQHFAYSNVSLLFISIACIVGIWLDYFLDTKFLKS
jgi:hypothetical protein